MRQFKLIFILMLIIAIVKADTEMETQTETEIDTQEANDNNDDINATEQNDDVSDEEERARHLTEIQVYTNDDRCNEIGICTDFDYGDQNVIVSFVRKSEISFTSDTTYRIKEPKDYFTLTFINSKFSNFPLNLFYAFKIKELDFRNCSLDTLRWDNFLMGDKLTILLLSENRLKEIKPMLFTYVENLSFLFLDSNQISILHNDSFKGLEKLNFLDLHDNLIESLPLGIFSYLPALQQIQLSGNRLKIIENALFANNPHLFSIHLQQNRLNDIQEYVFQNQYNIKYLDISNNPDLEALVVGNMKVENLWAKNCSLNRVNIYGEVVHVDLYRNAIKELYFSQPEYLETLRLKDNALEKISSLALTTNLRTLDVSNNPELKNLPDMWQINSLERLDLSNTSLKEVPINVLNSPNQLRSLNVSCNQLQEINPLNFKYFEKLSQFYIHDNNWNCYNLQMLMDMVVKPLKISYTHDEYDENYPGEYIHGIKCMYRLEQSDDSNISPANIHEYNQLKFENVKELEKLRRELKSIIGIYEQKFSLIINKMNDLDTRLKQFERFNTTLWQHVSIVV